MLKEQDLWKTCRKHGGISVRYSENYNIYECIFPEYRKCCIVAWEDAKIPLDPATRRIAKSISQLCYLVITQDKLDKIISKVAKGIR